jgi:hypothetical protein
MFGVNLDDRLMSEDVSLETDDVTITLWGGVDDLGDWEGWIPCQRETGGALLELPSSSAAILLPRRVVEA